MASKEASIKIVVNPRLGVRATAVILILWHQATGETPQWLIRALFSFKAA